LIPGKFAARNSLSGKWRTSVKASTIYGKLERMATPKLMGISHLHLGMSRKYIILYVVKSVLTESIEFFCSDFTDACVRTRDDGSFSVQPSLTRALTAEHYFHFAVYL